MVARMNTWDLEIRAWRMAAILLSLAFAGCGPAAVDDALTVATTWPEIERSDWEGRVRQSPSARPIRWLVLAPGDDLSRLATRKDPPDLILGLPAIALEALSRRALLEPGGPGQPAWRIAPLGRLGYVATAGRPEVVLPLDLPSGLTFDDPRRDPAARAWAQTILDAGAWRAGYARLVLAARGPRPPGRRPGSAVSAVLRGEAGAAPVLDADRLQSRRRSDLQFIVIDDGRIQYRGIAAVRGARHASEARALIDEQALLVSLATPDASATGSPDALALLADLLGSTLVDANDELRAAWKAVEESGSPARPRAWMTEPPPWPPASVAKILRRDANAMPMVETLAAQVAPDADVRGWLLRSWLAPTRPVDGRLLRELADAAGGRLVREPRFRAWLRGEWTAWARQRYRRVARRVRAGQGVS